jgi:hypothetical protein
MLTLKILYLLGVAPLVASPTAPDVFKPDRDHFFAKCTDLRLRRAQIGAVNGLMDRWEQHGDGDKRKLAFILATARRESSGTWMPVREAPRCGSDEGCRERAIGRMLQVRAERRGRTPRANYALPTRNGQRYYGRGYIQLTFEGNYLRAGEKLGLGDRLRRSPDEVMQPELAQSILVRAMMEGWYGDGRPLSHWLNDAREDWINARNNVNPGSPNKPLVAASARYINSCLRSSQR